MLKWLFSKKQSVSDKQPRHEESTPGNSSAFFQDINEKRNEDPLIGAKIAYFGNIRTPISVVSGQHNGNIRTL